MSHQTEILPLTQGVGYLERENIYATTIRFGEVRATIHDYVFHCTKTPHIETMNFWNLIRTQEIWKLDVVADDQTDGNYLSDRDLGPSSTRKIYIFSPGHPQCRYQGHRARTVSHWTKYLAKRLPDLNDLEDGSNLLAEQREERRIEYAKGVLTIIQNFYESFCHSTPETEALDFSEPDLQQLAKEENEAVENNDEQDSDIDLEEENAVEKWNEICSDHFIAAL
ncbi:hypothetical protein OUZ56_012078 [Daphnia magna]|uniref:Uncharacterized protein n=1 Tax=Daphnia magna TaxID=35525 RepID=A0ABQ9Z221_9CRUS|nr:hypothetical protein OUZ56_012078 [Daphnia magna]